jgi:benzoyl-CoA reductase/2-hydroxyglutaryl-CoA dehydratase subunit BcrC/BadD/HgdB
MIIGFKLEKVCPYLEASDMIVGENTCDGKKKAYESLNDIISNLHVMDIPQMKTDQGRSLLKSEYYRFKETVENLTGVAKKPCIRRLLEETLERQVLIPEDPQMIGALGAALLAGENK